MKNKKLRKITIIFLVLMLLFPSFCFGEVKYPEPTDKFYVNDYADVIDEDVEVLIAENGYALDEKTGAQVVLVTVNFTDGIPIHEYAADLFNKWKLGSAEKNNGLLILMSIGEEDYWAVPGKGLETTLTAGIISDILYEYLEPDFAVGNYSQGAAKVYEAFIKKLGGSWRDVIHDGEGSAGAGTGSSTKTDNIPNSSNSPVPVNRVESPRAGLAFFRILFIFFLLYIIIFMPRRRYYRRIYGVPYNPFRRRIIIFRPWSFWRRRRPPFSPPPPGPPPHSPPPPGGFWFGGHRPAGPGPSANKPPKPEPKPGPKPGPFSSGGSPWGNITGGGGSTRGGGAGRSSFSGGLFGGGSSSSRRSSFGGGAGRSSSGGSRSFGGRTGGGGMTRGGGAGRRK